MEPRIVLARVMTLGAFTCGVIGLIVGLIDRTWRLGAVGWFTGGTLLAVLVLAVYAEQYFVSRRQAESS